MVKKATHIIILLAFSLTLLLTSEANASNRMLNIRHWVAPDHTRIVIDTSEAPDYTVEKNKEHIRIDFKSTTYPSDLPKKTILNKPGVLMISITSLAQQIVRVEISLADHVDTNVFKLSKIEDKPDRVVVDIELPEVVQKETKEREQVKITRKDRIVIIDPGHGGDDPGAIGWSGVQEKDVVLKIGRKLKDILNKREGYRAFLTRDGDYYVPFNKRLKIAREYGADLFLSIHADAANNHSASGTSVYCLSTGGATTEAAKLLANKENLADVIGGSPNGENNDASDPIVLNMYQTNTINTSKTYGTSMLKHMGQVIPVKFAAVQGAPFRVLKLPEIPSMLVETAYISNKREEKLLISKQYQKKIAYAMANAVSEFLPIEPQMKPPPVINLAGNESASSQNRIFKENGDSSTKIVSSEKKQTLAISIQTYRVKHGDTIEKIAIKYNTSVTELLKLNKMKLRDTLYAGRKIKIAPSDKNDEVQAPSQAPVKVSLKSAKKEASSAGVRDQSETFVYKVKEGETLERIAKKHETSLSALLKINNMKLRDSLHTGRVIKIREKSVQRESKTVASESVSRKSRGERFTYYKVKKGETLDIIARRNGVTISQLRQLNRMKPSDPLLAEQRLKLPSQSSL